MFKTNSWHNICTTSAFTLNTELKTAVEQMSAAPKHTSLTCVSSASIHYKLHFDTQGSNLMNIPTNNIREYTWKKAKPKVCAGLCYKQMEKNVHKKLQPKHSSWFHMLNIIRISNLCTSSYSKDTYNCPIPGEEEGRKTTRNTQSTHTVKHQTEA